MKVQPQRKICPNCAATAALTSPICVQCGHAYRTQFVPSPSKPALDLPAPNPPRLPKVSARNPKRTAFWVLYGAVGIILWLVLVPRSHQPVLSEPGPHAFAKEQEMLAYFGQIKGQGDGSYDGWNFTDHFGDPDKTETLPYTDEATGTKDATLMWYYGFDDGTVIVAVRQSDCSIRIVGGNGNSIASQSH